MLTFIYSDNLIHLPADIVNHRKGFKDLKQKYGDKLSKEILMKELGIFGDAADNLKSAYNLKVESLDVYLGVDRDGSLKDVIKDETAVDPSIHVDKQALKDHILKICDRCLTNNEKKVISLMFLGDDYVNIAEIAEQLNVSSPRIRQVRDLAFKKLQHGFMNNWDIKHKEASCREVTGFNGYLGNYHMRAYQDPRYIEKMKKKHNNKLKKIFMSLLGK